MSNSIQTLTQTNFASCVQNTTQKPLLADFWASWCGPCRALAPLLEELCSEMGEQVAFGKLNIDENGDIAQEYGVMSIPTLILFKHGAEVKRIVGLRGKEDLINELNEHL